MAAARTAPHGPKPTRSAPLLAPLVAWVCAATLGPLPAQIQSLPAPPAGYVEAGVPDFVILGPEALGLSSTPVDFKRLPDGRFVAAALREIAIGDGTRWDVFPEVSRDTGGNIESLMVEDDGAMYSTTGDSVGRIRFSEEGRWWRETVKHFPADQANRAPNLVYATRVAGQWYWYGQSGCITRWTDSPSLQYLGSINNIGSLFEAAGQVYASDSSNGRLYRIGRDAIVPVLTDKTDSPDYAITEAAPYDQGRVLVATVNRGIQIFDGATLANAPRPALLEGGRHITALCGLADGIFVAAVENFGLVFFDRAGRILQALDRSNDHRLAHVQRLVPGDPGEIWALLRGGLARIAVPSPISHIEPLVENGFTFALPVRHQDRLWLCADGVALRGEYGPDRRLLRFVPDSPPGRYVYQLFPDPEAGVMLASTDGGLLILRDDGWTPGVPAPKGMHLFARRSGGSRWFFSAPGQIGWVVRRATGYHLEAIPVPGLADSFGGVVDRHNVAWIELGTGKCARVDLQAPALQLEYFGQNQGLHDSWVQLFLYHDEMKAVVGGRVLCLDPASRQFIPDEVFDRRFPKLIPGVVGRPIHDSAGRFWIMANAIVNVFDDTGETPRRLELPNLYGLRPYYSIAQDDGVIWMHRSNFLVRYDPGIPSPPPQPLRAHIGRVHLLADNRSLFPAAGHIPEIAAGSNTLSVHFVATGAPLGATVVFETRLGGTAQDWVAAGSTGTAVYNRLKEGDYHFQVRPRIGDQLGEEAVLAFTVLPPWYRSAVAYAAYALAALSLAAFIAWLGAFLEKREKRRLARLVAERTAELHDSNRRLVAQVHETTLKADELRASEERFRRLNEELEKRVAARTAALAASNQELEAFSYSVSHDLRAPLRNISGFAELLHKHLHGQIAPAQAHYLELVSTESVRLGQLVDSLLAFSRLGRTELQRHPCDLGAIVAAVRAELRPSLTDREIEWRIGPLPVVEGDPTLLRQVFANLLGNAVKFTRGRDTALIEVGAQPAAPDSAELILFVRDNGAGFDPQYSAKLFGVFQRLHRTTEFEGTGIGLANVRRIVARHGGRVWAEGRLDAGATFYFSLPTRPPAAA